MQNTFSQSGNDSKWFSKKSFFRIGMWHSRPPRDPPPPPFMANTILNFHFDYPHPSLRKANINSQKRKIRFKNLLFQLLPPQRRRRSIRIIKLATSAETHNFKLVFCQISSRPVISNMKIPTVDLLY